MQEDRGAHRPDNIGGSVVQRGTRLTRRDQ
jgi:hypothetical protein